MNRLDEIERAIARASWATDDAIYFSSETRDDILALVAVARAALRLVDDWAASGIDGQTMSEDELMDALAPLLKKTSADAGEGQS
jgi:hypothetical protein